MALPKILGQIPAARTDEGLLVVAKPVKKIQDGKDTRLIGVIARRQKRAVGNLLAEDFAFQRETFRSACFSSRDFRPRRDREQRKGERGDSDQPRVIHTAAPRRGSAARRATRDRGLPPGLRARRTQPRESRATTARRK